MNAQEYMTQRVDDQIAWYDGKSQHNQRWYTRLRVSEAVAAASIPVLVVLQGTPGYLVALLGAGIAVIAALLGIYQFQERWIAYRTTAESLKKEKLLFLTASEPYLGDPATAFRLLVQRIETLVSKENTNWSQLAGQTREGAKAG